MGQANPEIACRRVFEEDLTFYKAVIDTLKVPVFVVNQIGIFVYANKAATLVTGYDYADIVMMRFVDLFPAPNGDDPFELLLAGNFECRAKFKHKEELHIPVTIKAYNFSKNEKRKFYYQIILKDFFLEPDELGTLYTPLVTLATHIKKVNDELEQSIRQLSLSINPSTD